MAALVVLAVGGSGSTAVVVVAMLLGGAGAVWLVSAAFFTVGRSEDVDRERRPGG